MFGGIFHDYFDLPWEQARGFLVEELQQLRTALNSKWGAAFTPTGTLQTGTILGDPTPATRYVANTGVANAPTWDQVDLSNGVKSKLPFSHITALGASTLAGRGSASGAGDIQEIALGSGLSMSGMTLSAAGSISHTTVTLTNAQIKALPTTPITIVAAPGAGSQLVPFLIDVKVKLNNGAGSAYTNIDADSFMWALFSGGREWSNFLGNDSVLGNTYLSDALGAIHHAAWQFIPYTLTEPLSGWGNIVSPAGNTFSNESLQIQINNNGSGNLTGGVVANAIVLDIYYTTVTI